MKPVFIHISKTAGTSIAWAAGDHIVNAGHRTAASWIGEHGTGDALFAVVRHPYARVQSEYRYRRARWESGEQNAHLGNLALPFEGWVEETYAGDAFRTQGFFERTGVEFRPSNMIDGVLLWFLPQVRWLADGAGHLLVDDVLGFETLERDWAAFQRRHGFVVDLPRANRTDDRDIETPMTDDVREVIHSYYRVDFETFGYEP